MLGSLVFVVRFYRSPLRIPLQRCGLPTHNFLSISASLIAGPSEVFRAWQALDAKWLQHCIVEGRNPGCQWLTWLNMTVATFLV